MKKKILCGVLALLMLAGAMAESYGYITCSCRRKKYCVCFLQVGDVGPAAGGVIELLKAWQYLPQKHAKQTFDEEVTAAVMAFQEDIGLSPTGWLDDATLTYLIWGNYDAWYGDYAAYASETVWVSTSGGSKYHVDPYCSNMICPRKMSILNADALGLEPCRKCFPY